jgi:hypothetical protein
MNATDIKYPQGRYNPSGVTRVLYAFTEDILTMPVMPDPETAATFPELIEMDTAIVMKPGKKFSELYCTLEEGELKSKQVGPRDGKGKENEMGISFPGNDALFLGFEAQCANRTLVFLVLEKNGKWRVFGSLEDPAYSNTSDYTSGKKIADGRATVMMFTSSGATAPPIYKPVEGVASLLVPAA